MSKILITGAGHSGTNLVLEILRAQGAWHWFPEDAIHTEDRQLDTRKNLPDNYGTKLCTENTFIHEEFLDSWLKENPDAHVVFCVRNPIDTCLARIYKFKSKEGYDAAGNLEHIGHTAKVLDFLMENYRDRLHIVFMSNLVCGFEYEATVLLRSLGLKDHEIKPEVRSSYKNMRIKEKKKKYGDKLDCRQANLRENEEALFDDFWKTSPFDSEKRLVENYFSEEARVWAARPSGNIWRATFLEDNYGW